jgi:glycosyltransferase involved in cell wall biosynthesis
MSSPRPTLSIAMIARNEEAILARTLESVRWADEIVIVDSGSTDRTPEIARSFGARHIFNRDFRGFGPQKDLAIDTCTSDWIYLLDADEVVPPELAEEIQQTIAAPKFDAFWQPRINLFMDRWIRHGGFYPDKKLRLFRRGSAHMAGAEPHGSPQCTCPSGSLTHALQHYAYPSFRKYLSHMNGYSSDGAAVLAARGKHSASLFAFTANALLNPVLTFVKNYFFRLGFLDGRQGLILHINHSVYVHWKYVKAWESARSRGSAHGQPGDTES